MSVAGFYLDRGFRLGYQDILSGSYRIGVRNIRTRGR
jgi:hypothetical protein